MLTVALSIVVGVCVGAGAISIIALCFREHAEALADIQACELHFVVHDYDGQPVSDVQLVLINARDGTLWRPIGNWRGLGSLVTDSNGRVAFILKEGQGYGGHSWRLWGYERSNVPLPQLELRCEGYACFSLPLTGPMKKATINVVCERNTFPNR